MAIGAPLVLSESEQQSGHLIRTSLTADGDQSYQECLLQKTIDDWPNVLPIGDFYPNVTGLCSLGREIPVDIGNTEGSIDNLLVTNDGHLIIVETKLLRNPELSRAVVAQALQYAMAINQLSLDELESRLRRRGRLGPDETILQRARASLSGMTDDFEDAFDRTRLAGEILLLIVADGIRSSAERLVQWMNDVVGSAPYKLGLVEMRLYDLPGVGRLVVPRTLLRTREASRHVVTINLQGPGREHITATVSAPNELPKVRKIASPGIPITEEELAKQIAEKNDPKIGAMADQLRSQLSQAGLQTRGLATTIQYGLNVAGEFIPLGGFQARNMWFQIPVRAKRDLGDERFVACRQKINNVAPFYRAEDVSDPDKINALTVRYEILQGRVEAFVDAVRDIAETVRVAVTEAS